MHGGTFQSYISFWVTLRGGDLWRGGGGEPGPGGNLRCLCCGGSNGSTWTVYILATRCLVLSDVSPFDVNLTISESVVPSFWIFVPYAAYFLIPKISSILSLADLIVFWFSSCDGFFNSYESRNLFLKLCATVSYLFWSFFTIIYLY